MTHLSAVTTESRPLLTASSALRNEFREETQGRGLKQLPEPSMSKFRQALRFMTDPFNLLTEVRKECGDLFALHLPGMGQVVFLCTAPLLTEVYRKGEGEVVAGEIRRKMVGYLMGSRSSLSIDGDQYLKRRKLMAPYFSAKHLECNATAFRELTESMIDRWPVDQAFSLTASFEELSCRLICRFLYGDSRTHSELMRASMDFLNAFRSPAVHMPPLQWNLGRLSPWGRFLATRRNLREALLQELRRRSSTDLSAKTDLMSGLLAARLDDEEDLAHETIVQEMLNLLVGGGGTAATAAAWTVLGLASNQETWSRLRDEIDRVIGRDPVEPHHLRDMPYLDAVIHEGLRYQPVAPFAGPRLVKKDIEIGGFPIAADTIILQGLSEVGRSDLFPNPDCFDPDNFFERGVHIREWMPFGGGSRVCTGMGLAKFQIALTLTTLMQRFDVELEPGSHQPTRRGIVFQPKNGLRVRVHPRSNQ